ncbi:MAG: hypothetical protein ACLFS1_06205 [Opitutales bacterium]
MKKLFQMTGITFLALMASLVAWADRGGASQEESLGQFVDWLLVDDERLEDVPFAEVVEAVSGCRIIAVEADRAEDAFVLRAIEKQMDALLLALSQEGHPVHGSGRINETSRYIEDALLEGLDAVEGLRCATPLNAAGKMQRSGYPDLRIEHQASGRVYYLDPKVYKASSEQSSFRTFYFEPKGETNKILDDASHLIIGVAHTGKSEAGLWQFTKWQLIDLAAFRVRLKAEFQASNRDLYREEAVLLRGGPAAVNTGQSE